MRILTKKILRDIRYQRGRSFSIIFIIMLAMGLYSGILMSYDNAEESFLETERELNLHSARYLSSVPFDPDEIIVTDLDHYDKFVAWDTRLALLSNFYINGDTDLSFTSPLFGIDHAVHPKVDDIILQSGSFLSDVGQVLVEQSFLEAEEMDIGDTLQLNFGQNSIQLEIVGGVFSAEFLYNVNPKTSLPDLTGLAPLWLSIDQLQSLSGISGANEVLVRFTDAIHENETLLEDITTKVQIDLEVQMDLEFTSTVHHEEPDQEMKEGDLGALDDFARVFGGVVLLIALFAIYDNISKLIASQRNYIGTMRAMGGSRSKVTLHYTNLAMTLSFAGILLGIPLGLLISYGMITEYSAIIGIPPPEITFQLEAIIEAVVIHVGLALLISLATSARAAGIEPREAMSSAYITQIFRSKPIIERILGGLGSFGPTTAIPIRNIFRNKRKSLLTIFTFAISIVLMVAALGFTDSFNNSLQTNYEDRQKYDMEVYFSQSLPMQEIDSLVNDIVGISTIEGFISDLISLHREDSSSTKPTAVYAFERDSVLREFDFIEGDMSKAIIPSLLASDLDLKVGDDLEIHNTTVEISGIVNEIVSEAIYLDLESMQDILKIGNNITGIIVELEEDVDQDDIQEELKSKLPVTVIIATEDVKDSIEYLIQGLFAIIGVMVLIGFLTVALFSFNTIVLEIISRENEFVNLKSLGSSRGKIIKIILIQSLIVSITGAVLSIPLSLVITDWAIKAMMQDLMSIETMITLQSFVISIGSALLASSTGIIAAYRYVMKIDLVNAMRNRVSN